MRSLRRLMNRFLQAMRSSISRRLLTTSSRYFMYISLFNCNSSEMYLERSSFVWHISFPAINLARFITLVCYLYPLCTFLEAYTHLCALRKSRKFPSFTLPYPTMLLVIKAIKTSSFSFRRLLRIDLGV